MSLLNLSVNFLLQTLIWVQTPGIGNLTVSDLNNQILLEYKDDKQDSSLTRIDHSYGADLMMAVFRVNEYHAYSIYKFNHTLYVVDNFDVLNSTSSIDSLTTSTKVYAYTVDGKILWSVRQYHGLIETIDFYNSKCSHIELTSPDTEMKFEVSDTRNLTLDEMQSITEKAREYGFEYSKKIYSHFLKADIKKIVVAFQ